MVDDSGISNETKDILQRLKTVMNDSNSSLTIDPTSTKSEGGKIIDLTQKIEEREEYSQEDISDQDIFDVDSSQDTDAENDSIFFDQENSFEQDFNNRQSSDEDQHDVTDETQNNDISLDDLTLDEEEKLSSISTNENIDFDEDIVEFEAHNNQEPSLDNDDLLASPENNIDINTNLETDLDGDDQHIFVNEGANELQSENDFNLDIDLDAESRLDEEEDFDQEQEEEDDLQPIAISNINWEDAVRNEFNEVDTISLNEVDDEDLIDKAVENAKNKIKEKNRKDQPEMRLPKNKSFKASKQFEDEFQHKDYDLDQFILSDFNNDLDPEIDYHSISSNYGLDDNEDDVDLISEDTKKSTKDLFSEFQSNYKQAEHQTKEHNSSLEGIAKEMLKASLKEWLDKNLSSIVERLVKEEIEKLKK